MQSPPASPASDALRIAWLVYRGNPHSGGQGVYTRYIARELQSMGHYVEVLSGPPYPILDDGVRLVKIASMDLFRADDPWHIPSPHEIAERFRMADGIADLGIDAFEFAHMCTSGFPEPWTYSMRARRYLRRNAHDFDVVHDNQCFGYGVKGIQDDGLAVVATLHHPITVDRDLEIADLPRVYPSKLSAKYAKRRWSLWRWYGFLGMQVRVARQIPRIITVSESSKRDIVDQMHVRPEQLHIVPVGVDHQRFRPMPDVARVPHRIMTTASADVPLKGLRPLLEALAKVRTEHPIDVVIVGKKREGSVLPELLDRLGLNDVVTFEQFRQHRAFALFAHDGHVDRMLGADLGKGFEQRAKPLEWNVGGRSGHDAVRLALDVRKRPEPFVIDPDRHDVELFGPDVHLGNDVALRRLRHGDDPGDLTRHLHLHPEEAVPAHQ